MPYIGRAPTASITKLEDADQDTKIQVEESSDEDIIRFDIAGAEDFTMTANTLTALSGSTIATNTIAETTGASGVTIDGLLIKDSTAAFADGAVGTPSITNTGDLNSGVYFPAADTVGVTTGGTEQFRFGSNPIPGGSKNMLINGAMTVHQRGGTIAATVNTQLLDMFASTLYDASEGASAVANVTQDSSAPAGFANSMKFDVTTIATGGGDYNSVKQRIEAQNLQHLKYGTADALTCTFSFWFKTTITGIYSAYFYHHDASYTYIREFTVAASDTWEFFQVTLPGYTATNFDNNTGTGLEVGITLASDSLTGAVDTWQSGGDSGGSANQVNGLSSTSNNIYTTGWQFEVGSVATDFAHEDIGTTLQKCQRYFFSTNLFEDSTRYAVGAYDATNGLGSLTHFPTTMRAAPTAAFDSSVFRSAHDGALFDGTITMNFTNQANGYMANISTQSSATQGEWYWILDQSGDATTGQITFTAEL